MNKTVKILIAVIVVIVLGASGAIAFILTRSSGEKEEPRFIYDPAISFVTNVQDSDALVKTTLVVQVIGEDTLNELTENAVKVNDCIISVLREKTKDEMKSPEIQDQLKTEICSRLMTDLQMEDIETVFFNELVVTN